MSIPEKNGCRLRVLVAIASYGEKNLKFLKQIIHNYQSMAMDVDVVVFSEAPKALGPAVKLVVGLPSKNPWSLPVAHKPFLAHAVDQYDLFIYSEDDVEVSESNILAFLRATPVLESDEIAGYLRFEIGAGDTPLLTDVHGAFRWKPESVRRRGEYVIAEFTNEHAGFYILTRAQLQQAIASGGFLKEPYEGRYGLPETAATDPYTVCGLRKVVCISALDDFLLHHMSNLYVSRHGVLLAAFKEQIQTLVDICNNVHPASTLCEVESRFLHNAWSKSYYEPPCAEILEMVPERAGSILSVGCGWGETEVKLQQRGAKVTALPLDSVIGAAAARRGVEVIYGTIEEGPGKLRGRKFDCVVMTNLLHLLPHPWRILGECVRLLQEEGTLIISGPNFGSLPVLVRRAFRRGDYPKLKSFAQSGIHPHRWTTVKRQIERAGLRVTASQWIDQKPTHNWIATRRWMRGCMAMDWIIQAQRKPKG
jgi:2-polyprenyl-3-methyl-5-hydroxy-6-metoxy-1,4-benzoquinol methylase